jgi:hypothetical protein
MNLLRRSALMMTPDGPREGQRTFWKEQQIRPRYGGFDLTPHSI